MYELDEKTGRYVPAHHPFTKPEDGFLEKVAVDPGSVRAHAYDLVLNGVELGSGSIRIHDQALQQKIFETLGIGPEEAREKFGFLLDAFDYGAPPHGGIAIGIDRLIALLLGHENIREVIAFPKTATASCLLTGAPAPAPAKAPVAVAAAATATTPPPGVESAFAGASQQAAGPGQAGVEQGKIRNVLESIRNFVRAAERGADNIVPLRGGNVVLTPAEVEAFRTDFGQEKSFRADQANFYMEEVALHTRMMNELADYKAKRDSAYLWKPHADSLTYLLTASSMCVEGGKSLVAVAKQRGLGEKVKGLSGSIDKLRAQIQYVAKALQG